MSGNQIFYGFFECQHPVGCVGDNRFYHASKFDFFGPVTPILEG